MCGAELVNISDTAVTHDTDTRHSALCLCGSEPLLLWTKTYAQVYNVFPEEMCLKQQLKDMHKLFSVSSL